MKSEERTVKMILLFFVVTGISMAVVDHANAMSLFGGGSHSSPPRQTLAQNNPSSQSSINNGLSSINANPVTVTPEPATVVLLGSGLFSLMLWRLKNRS